MLEIAYNLYHPLPPYPPNPPPQPQPPTPNPQPQLQPQPGELVVWCVFSSLGKKYHVITILQLNSIILRQVLWCSSVQYFNDLFKFSGFSDVYW